MVVALTPTGCLLTTVSGPHSLLSTLVPESFSQCPFLVESGPKGPVGGHGYGPPASRRQEAGGCSAVFPPGTGLCVRVSPELVTQRLGVGAHQP